MSFAQLMLALLVGLVIINSDDLVQVIKAFKSINLRWQNFRKQIFSTIQDAGINELVDEAQEMNFYLEKIIAITGKYEGEYSIQAIKEQYQRDIKKIISSETKTIE